MTQEFDASERHRFTEEQMRSLPVTPDRDHAGKFTATTARTPIPAPRATVTAAEWRSRRANTTAEVVRTVVAVAALVLNTLIALRVFEVIG